MKKIIPILILSFLLISLGQIAIALTQTDDLPSSGLLPDSSFYFLKTWKESIQLFFTFGAENKAKQFLHLSEVRLAEYQKMIEKSKTEVAQKTLEKYEKQLGHALEKAGEAQEKGRDVGKLKEEIGGKILKHQEVLERVLEKVPEEAKSGIEKAIESSQKGFEKTLEAIPEEKLKEKSGRKSEEIQETKIIIPSAEDTSITGKGWVKTIDLTHVCKEPCPGEFVLGLLSRLIRPVQQTSDGGYVIAGGISNLMHTADGRIVKTISYPYLLKMDADGNQWNKTYEIYGFVNAIEQTSDGGYILAAERSKEEGGSYLMKTDASGNMQWNKVFEFCSGFYPEQPRSIQQTTDGGYVVVGWTPNCGALKDPPVSTNTFVKGGTTPPIQWPRQDMFLLKTDADGNEVWNKMIRLTVMDAISSVFQVSDGGYAVVVYTSSFGVKQILYVLKVDSTGNMQWNKTFEEYNYDVGSSARQTSDGGFILIQRKNFPFTQRSEYELYAFKLDANGNKLWEKALKFSSFPEVRMISAVQTSDRGYMAVAKKGGGEGGENDFYLVKFDENGHEMWYKWHKIVPFAIDNMENRLEALLIQQTSDGGYILSGVSAYSFILSISPETSYPEGKYYVIKTDENGN